MAAGNAAGLFSPVNEWLRWFALRPALCGLISWTLPCFVYTPLLYLLYSPPSHHKGQTAFPTKSFKTLINKSKATFL